jgi:hypothetical protein
MHNYKVSLLEHNFTPFSFGLSFCSTRWVTTHINASKDGSLYFGPYLYTSLSILQKMYAKKIIIIIIFFKKNWTFFYIGILFSKIKWINMGTIFAYSIFFSFFFFFLFGHPSFCCSLCIFNIGFII